jgi:hypothetical protein
MLRLTRQSAWIIGAVCPARDTGVALVMTRIDTAAMNLFLVELSQAVAPGAHGILLMDEARWHTADQLRVPENLGPVFPPYSTRSSGCGCIGATSPVPLRLLSTPVARLGTGCSLKPVVSVPYAPIRGSNRSAINQAGISALDLGRRRNAVLDIGLGFPPIAMGPPYHVASDLFVLNIGIEDRIGILDGHWP